MGPLSGFRIIEITGLGPGPFCGMMLADMGAEVIRVERSSARPDSPVPRDPLARSRKSIALDLKSARGTEVLLRLVGQSDGLFEGFRPGVAERLGFGPEACLQRNAQLVYGRITGWGQDGPLAHAAGHDINYIALSGALHAIGVAGGKPVPPLNLVGDFGGGGMLLAFGMVCALLQAQRTGVGQVVDAAMVDGALAQMAMSFGLMAEGLFSAQPGSHALAGAAPFYDTYETADGRFVAIGSLEPQFFRVLLEKTGIPHAVFADAGFHSLYSAMNTSTWPELRRQLAAAFLQKTRDEWCAIMEGSDVCFAPVLTLSEVNEHAHNQARKAVIEIAGVMQNAPAPRFSVSITGKPTPPRRPGEDSDSVLAAVGFSGTEIQALRKDGIIT
jgi:alpha-methylacyl-CoA racemase